MITTVVAILIAVIPAIFVAESVAKRRRVAKWKHSHVNIGDDEFVASVGSVSVPRDAVIRVRQEIARATRLPVNLISASDPIRELEMLATVRTGRFWITSRIFCLLRRLRMTRRS
jgi:hypothetical protein